MKLLRLLTALAGLAAASIAVAQGTVLYSWDFSKAANYGPTVEAPENSGGPEIIFRSGATLKVDADEQGRQVLSFDGTQTDWGRSKRNIDPISAIQLRLRFRPASTGAPLQTIVSLCGCYELRYNLGRSRLEFIVNLPEKKYLMVKADISPDVWNQAVATYKDGKLTLAVGLSRAEDVLPEGLRPVPISTSVRVGLVGERPFNGSISEFVVSEL
ncbi:MAG: LamG domain-containing protein [Opitutaceae bacterium]|jgi:hypothetical protein|nr:LamG domain-containing protein [Opitutaceae bacterium]